MKLKTMLRIGQVAGALLMAAGVTACTLKSAAMPILFIAGGAIYAGCRLAEWFRS